MKILLRKLLVSMCKFTYFGIILQAFFVGALLARAGDVHKNLSVKKVYIDLETQRTGIVEVFQMIEANSGLKFFYDRKIIEKQAKFDLSYRNASVYDILLDLSKQTGLRFKQVNMTINVSKALSGPSIHGDVEIIIQGREVTGAIVDENGGPLPGASILIKGTNQGTVSDANGRYRIEVPDQNAVLVISFIGYVTEEVTVGNQAVVDVALMPDITALQEVIVVGYGEQRKETLTGSVSNIKGEEITKSPAVNVSANLAGRLPGLIVNQRSGEPGRDDPNILIRGQGTYRDNSPLIVVDGVPRSLMSRLNPEDVESISVLKDASAAIYGARAANGVILITTKRGQQGKPVFNLSYNHAFQSPTKIPEVLDAATFAQVFNEAAWYRAGRPETGWSPPYTEEAIRKYADGSDPVRYPNTNWAKEVIKPYSTQRRVNISANGGTDEVRYFLSFGALYQDGAFRNDPTHYKQYNMRVKVDVNLTDNLNVGANLSAILNDRQFSSVATDEEVWVNFHNIYQANPTLVARYPNGLIGPGRLGENPLLLDQRGYFRRDDNPLFSTFTATYKIPFIDGLKVDASYNYDLSNQQEKRWRLPYFFYEYNTDTQEYERRQGTGIAAPELSDRYQRWENQLYNLRLNYDRNFGDHHIGVLVGTEHQENRYSTVQASRRNYVSPALDHINQGSSDPEDKDNSGTASLDGYNNYFGRFNYDFAGKYLAEFLFRYDGSQKFPKEKRYGFFPGVSVGWRMSEEPFMRDNFDFINQLKLRGSYGQIGNDRVAAYQHFQKFTFEDNYYFGGGVYPGVRPGVLPNPNITWETAEKMDVGLEAMFWNGLLGFEFTTWWEKRRDILATRNVSVSNVFGFPGLPDENIGKVNNHGFELSITHKNNISQLNYQVTANTAFARSKIIYMDEVPPAEPYMSMTGHPVGAGLFYKADGIFNTQEELDSYPHLPNTQVGDIKIVDLNNDNVIDDRDQFRFNYSNTPEYVFGLNFDFQYKKFDLNIFFQGQTNVYNYDDRFPVLGNSAYDNALVARAKDRWTVDNPNGTMPRADSNSPGNNTMYLFDATFVRLKTLELSYLLPEGMLSSVGLDNARIYVSGFNLLTWAKEIKWSEPEAQGGLFHYPQLRVINLGLNVKF